MGMPRRSKPCAFRRKARFHCGTLPDHCGTSWPSDIRTQGVRRAGSSDHLGRQPESQRKLRRIWLNLSGASIGGSHQRLPWRCKEYVHPGLHPRLTT